MLQPCPPGDVTRSPRCGRSCCAPSTPRSGCLPVCCHLGRHPFPGGTGTSSHCGVGLPPASRFPHRGADVPPAGAGTREISAISAISLACQGERDHSHSIFRPFRPRTSQHPAKSAIPLVCQNVAVSRRSRTGARRCARRTAAIRTSSFPAISATSAPISGKIGNCPARSATLAASSARISAISATRTCQIGRFGHAHLASRQNRQCRPPAVSRCTMTRVPHLTSS